VSEGFWIDPAGVRASAPAFTELGQRMDEILATLRGKLESEGHCWGADDYGKAFQKDYLPAHDNAFQFFPQMSGGLKDIATGLEESADTASRGEDATHQKFKK
jgi:hypothetical protein